ncbi:Myosin-binding protein 3 [Glycine soja]|uniref:Myosin-binding protein 3 n=1 Tax=Glycine soja TaxID=3848 RepID=A0A445IKH1_GLYSO|nr:Myosin-binding protein 3 [Glycine soja]
MPPNVKRKGKEFMLKLLQHWTCALQELEEESSAYAIAANQTMAMINRLQEEKAAMQMEALQYQRMMEE